MIDPQFSRRDFVRLSVSALAAVSGAGAVSTLAGCGGGGGGGGDASATTRTLRGTIATAEIGGTGHQVVSARAAGPVAVGASGAFSTEVAAQNAQMLFVTDGSGIGRAMALALPGLPTTVGAASTALALAFSTPGIMASDPELARSAVARLQAHPKWSELVAEVRTELPKSGLAGLKTAKIGALLGTILDGFVAGDRDRGTLSTNADILFKGAWGAGSPAKQRLDLTHEGFRYVRVDVQRLDPAGNRLTHEVAKTDLKALTAMDPAGLASIGSLLVAIRTGAKNSPSGAATYLNLQSPAGTGRVKVYVSGIGLGANKETTPFTLGKAEMRESYWKSVFFVLIMPFLDVYLGGLGAKGIGSAGLDRINNMYASLGTRLSIDAVYDAVQSADWAAVSAAMIDYLNAALGFLSGIIESYGITGLSSAAIGAIVKLAGVAGLPIAAVNLGIIHIFLNRAPVTQSIELQVSAVEGTVG